jgi:ankyrin repeat protein
VVQLLVQTGKVDVDSKDESGKTPLSWAAEEGNKDVVQLLVETDKVDVDSKDKDERTPLSWAAESSNRWNHYEPVVKLLIATNKVDVNSKDKDGRTPLSWTENLKDTRVKDYEAVVKLIIDEQDRRQVEG